MPDSEPVAVFDLEARAAQLRLCIDEEQRTGYTPRMAADIPASVTDANAEWLTAVLCGGVPNAAVENVTFVGGSDGMTSRRGMRLRYNEAGRAAGLPDRLFGKATPHFESRLLLGMSGALFCEPDFYNILRPKLLIEAPVAHFAAADPVSLRSILLFADMADNGTIFTDPYHYLTRDQAEDMVLLMARFHSFLWRSPLLDALPQLRNALEFQQNVNAHIDFRARSDIGMDRAAAAIPESIRGRKDAIWNDGLMASMAINSRLPNTLVHGDVHIGNWYITPSGRVGLTDWQTIVRGHGAGDLAYALSSALTVEDRRAWEEDLVTLYVESLRSFGVEDDDGVADMWLYYRQQMFHALYNWLFTIGAGEMQPNMQPDDFAMINIGRIATAIDDLESLTAVQAGI